VSDLGRSLRFYCEGLGFEQAEGYELDDTMLPGLERALEVVGPVRLRSQMITHGGLKIELLHFVSPGPTGTPAVRRNELGFTHVSFVVDDLEGVAARLVALGGTTLDGTRAVLGYDVMFVADPDGTRVELMARAL
jgi:catechol 2,3-dioxygenase-like lactoylglutathione lyase family enzyme